jgi:hypothetical protein
MSQNMIAASRRWAWGVEPDNFCTSNIARSTLETAIWMPRRLAAVGRPKHSGCYCADEAAVKGKTNSALVFVTQSPTFIVSELIAWF